MNQNTQTIPHFAINEIESILKEQLYSVNKLHDIQPPPIMKTEMFRGVVAG